LGLFGVIMKRTLLFFILLFSELLSGMTADHIKKFAGMNKKARAQALSRMSKSQREALYEALPGLAPDLEYACPPAKSLGFCYVSDRITEFSEKPSRELYQALIRFLDHVGRLIENDKSYDGTQYTYQDFAPVQELLSVDLLSNKKLFSVISAVMHAKKMSYECIMSCIREQALYFSEYAAVQADMQYKIYQRASVKTTFDFMCESFTVNAELAALKHEQKILAGREKEIELDARCVNENAQAFNERLEALATSNVSDDVLKIQSQLKDGYRVRLEGRLNEIIIKRNCVKRELEDWSRRYDAVNARMLPALDAMMSLGAAILPAMGGSDEDMVNNVSPLFGICSALSAKKKLLKPTPGMKKDAAAKCTALLQKTIDTFRQIMSGGGLQPVSVVGMRAPVCALGYRPDSAVAQVDDGFDRGETKAPKREDKRAATRVHDVDDGKRPASPACPLDDYHAMQTVLDDTDFTTPIPGHVLASLRLIKHCPHYLLMRRLVTDHIQNPGNYEITRDEKRLSVHDKNACTRVVVYNAGHGEMGGWFDFYNFNIGMPGKQDPQHLDFIGSLDPLLKDFSCITQECVSGVFGDDIVKKFFPVVIISYEPDNTTEIRRHDACFEFFIGKNQHRRVCFHRLLRARTDYPEDSDVRQELDRIFDEVRA